MKQLKLLLILFLFTTCKPIPEKYESILEKAGDNKNEIKKAIRYFEKKGSSDEKKALYFLLANMHHKIFYKSSLLKKYNQLFEETLDTMHYNEILERWHNIENEYGPITSQRIKVVNDLEAISSEILINNVEWAYKVWKTQEWASHVDFSLFCEAILPYKTSKEPLEDWRERLYKRYIGVRDTIKDKSSVQQAVLAVNGEMRTWLKHHNIFNRYPGGIKPSDMIKSKVAICRHKNDFVTNACRAIGVPVVKHFTPLWANRDEGHAWCAAIKKDGSYFTFLGAEKIEINDTTQVPFPNKTGKIFEKTYAPFPGSFHNISKNIESVPEWLNDPYARDVTAHYPPAYDVKLKIRKYDKLDRAFVYLAVFNQPHWLPIHWARVKKENNNVLFEDMKENIVYLPVYYVDGKLVPAGSPFILHADGTKKLLIVNKHKKITLKLYRKYPLKERIIEFEEDLVGGTFQAA
jgi:hypothetical protein